MPLACQPLRLARPHGFRRRSRQRGASERPKRRVRQAREDLPKASPSGFGNEAPPEPYEHFELIRSSPSDGFKGLRGVQR